MSIICTMRFKFIILFTLYTSSLFATPLGCFEQDISFQEAELWLTKKQPALYLIKNKDSFPIFLNHDGEGDWLREINPSHYAAVLTTEPMIFSCFEKRPGSEMLLACKEVIEVCRLKESRLTLKNPVAAWLRVDLDAANLEDALQRDGILHIN